MKSGKHELQFVKDDAVCLHSKLQRTKWTIEKVSIEDKSSYLQMLIDGTLQGLYIVILETTSGQRTHTVSIDSKKGLVFDCMEKYPLVLCEEALNVCCVPFTQLKGIPLCYELKKT